MLVVRNLINYTTIISTVLQLEGPGVIHIPNYIQPITRRYILQPYRLKSEDAKDSQTRKGERGGGKKKKELLLSFFRASFIRAGA